MPSRNILVMPILGMLSLSVVIASGLAADPEKADAFAASAETRILPQPNVRGDDASWFFLVKELRHVASGQFWTKPWAEIAANGSDPVPSLKEFHDLLAGRGVKLLLVPIPAKAIVYPEKLDSKFQASDAWPMTPFLDRIKEQGIDVVDLESAFLDLRSSEKDSPLYCTQDAHYSPVAIEKIADRLATELRGDVSGQENAFQLGDPEEMTITGDQVAGSEWEGTVPGETLTVRKVLHEGVVGVEPDPESPVLLLGDSHTLVFHEGAAGGMHCKGAGLADHLSQRLGLAVDLVGVRGSGMVQARKQLFYRAAAEPGFWDRKKVVIWVFSVREFTQSTDRLIAIPLDRQP